MNKDTFKLNQQFKYYTFLSMFYVVLIVAAQSLAYRMIQLGVFLLPGGIFLFPASFTVTDVIAEVYGPTLARRAIFFGLITQAFFSAATLLVNHMPYPNWWLHAASFNVVFGSTWLVFLSNLIAILVGMVLNTQIIGKTKLLAKGKFFSIRSIFSSAIGEFILTALIVLIALVPVAGFKKGTDLFVSMFLFKVAFSLVVVIPASFFVVILKKIDEIDVYEENISFNPLNIFSKNISSKNLIDITKFIKNVSKV